MQTNASTSDAVVCRGGQYSGDMCTVSHKIRETPIAIGRSFVYIGRSFVYVVPVIVKIVREVWAEVRLKIGVVGIDTSVQ
jgi:hypothetical protein